MVRRVTVPGWEAAAAPIVRKETKLACLPSHFSLLGTLPHGTVLPHSGRALPVQSFLEIPWKAHLEDVSL